MPGSLLEDALHLVLEDIDYIKDLDSDWNHKDEWHSILANLCDKSSKSTEVIALRHCEGAIQEARRVFRTTYHKDINTNWRRLFTDAIIISVCLQALDFPSEKDKTDWTSLVSLLDEAIVISGAPGFGRLDIVLGLISKVQKDHLPVEDISFNVSSVKRRHEINPPAALGNITIYRKAISLSSFIKASQTPFIIKSFASNWPALDRWSSPEYLLRAGGMGRMVPVEVGYDYTSPEWKQKLVKWEAFLASLFNEDGSTLYLAQHTLLKQMPALSEDIYAPDYVYTSLQAPSYFPGYKRPTNEEQFIVNAWIGPKHTVSPAHTDPFYNCYVQVVGRKTVWLAPPEVSELLKRKGETDELLGNTSCIDVFSSCEFDPELADKATSAVLEAGDMLFMPPMWWHAMRSEEMSASVSFWF